ncbi:hypothetical protein CEXT_782041 [Caerostris extrusa]|uniref:Uncharacterized protein n=1 Tax=Caerostris extrusa TaxID=172846 RepID=A0AAV4VPV3_CAEEX|nr:hypothetical protein CEXT_782041 [Caerostris extrusa]
MFPTRGIIKPHLIKTVDHIQLLSHPSDETMTDRIQFFALKKEEKCFQPGDKQTSSFELQMKTGYQFPVAVPQGRTPPELKQFNKTSLSQLRPFRICDRPPRKTGLPLFQLSVLIPPQNVSGEP